MPTPGLFGPEVVLNGNSLTPIAMPSTSVTVKNTDGSAATLYTDSTGSTTTSNVVSTNTRGELSFYALPGYYDIIYTDIIGARTLRVEVDESNAHGSATYPTATILVGTGIDPTGVADSTAAIQTLVTAALGPVVGVPGAIYKISTVTLKDGSYLIGNGASITCTAAAAAGAFEASAKTGLRVEDWTISGTLGAFLLKSTACSDVALRRNKATTINLIHTRSAGGNVYSTASATENTDIRVEDNRASAATSGTVACVDLFYASGVTVRGNRINGYGHGIQFWGGDANPTTGNGAVANTRKAQNISIVGNVVTSPAQGGIWGAMGQDVTVTGNVVVSAGDVGIDFEGCVSATASGNTVRDCTNGQLATFFFGRDVLFSGNTAQVGSSAKPLLRVSNSTGDSSPTTGNISVSFVGNSLTCTSGLGTMILEATNTLLIASNTLRDVQINPTGNNMHNVYVLNNNLTFAVQGAAFKAIELGGINQVGGVTPFSRIVGNAISTLGSQPAGSVGILAASTDGNSSPTIEIKDNTIQAGFPTADIKTSWGGTNAGTRAVFGIVQNMVGGSSIVKDDTGAGQVSVQVQSGNRDASYTAVGAA